MNIHHLTGPFSWTKKQARIYTCTNALRATPRPVKTWIVLKTPNTKKDIHKQQASCIEKDKPLTLYKKHYKQSVNKTEQLSQNSKFIDQSKYWNIIHLITNYHLTIIRITIKFKFPIKNTCKLVHYTKPRRYALNDRHLT